MNRKLRKEFPVQWVWENPNKSQTGPVATEALLAKDGSVITDTLLAKNENNKKQERGMRMIENREERNDREFAVKKRDLCRELLEFLSEIREAKWIAEEKVRKTLADNEEYRWIVKMADTIEDDYEFLIYHTEDEGKIVIDEIEERMNDSVREFNKKCSCKQFG